MDVSKIRQDFPIFGRKINGKRFVYLDSASTSQKPVQVIEAVKEFYENRNSNVHRSIYTTSEESTEAYEGTREKVKKFLGAKDYDIVFTRNCTESINLVSQGWAAKNMSEDDTILSSVMEHHSNIVPWQRLADQGMFLDFIGVDDEGRLADKKIEKSTKIVSLAHVSNVLGTVNDVTKLTKECHDAGSLIMIDGAQSVPHMKIELDKIGCDFLAFSGHKMLAPAGVGVLAIKKEVAPDMGPMTLGSDMIKEVRLEGTTFTDSPLKFEAGTPNIEGVIGLSAAIDYLEGIGMDKIQKHESELTEYALKRLSENERIRVYGPMNDRAGIVSFDVVGVHSHDVASIMNQEGVAIRSGHHCAQPLMRRFGVNSMNRASFYMHNGKDDVDAMIDGIGKVEEVFKL